ALDDELILEHSQIVDRLRLLRGIDFQLHFARGLAIRAEDLHLGAAGEDVELAVRIQVERAGRFAGRSKCEAPVRFALAAGHPDAAAGPRGHEPLARYIDAQPERAALALLAGLFQGVGFSQFVRHGYAQHAPPVLVDAVEVTALPR